MKETLFLEFKDAMLSDAGELTGYGNVTGNKDRGGDIVLPGAYKNLSEFVRDGFGAVGHDWKQPVATIEEASEDENGLFVRMMFHTTDDAQECRQIVKERLERGKTVGLSIGYRVLEDEYREGSRLLKSIEVFEVSIVTVPMNAAALVLSSKGLVDGPYLESLSAVVDAVEEITKRTEAKADMRTKEGRVLSRTNREMLMACRDRMKEAHDHLCGLIDATCSDEPKGVDPAQLARILARRGELAA